jgi:hypothetical protein
MRHNHFYKQSGTAIFMALLVVTIVTTLSVAWFSQTKINVRRTQQMFIAEQIYLFADGVVSWGIGALKIDNTVPKILPATPIMGNTGIISGRIDDYKPSTQQNLGTATKSAMATQPNQYFLLRTDVKLADQHLILYSLLQKKIIDGKVTINIIWQSRSAT